MSLRRIFVLLLAGGALAAGCGKDVSQRTPPTVVVARFDSATATIPTPNDLALQAVPTLPAGAQKSLLQSFVESGGFPADQAPALTVPLRKLTWNGSSYDQSLPTVDPATVTAATVALFRVDGGTAVAVPVEAAAAQKPGALLIVPSVSATGSRRLAPGRYVFAIRGGLQGVKTDDAHEIVADSPVSLTIVNKDMTRRENQPPGLCPADGPATCPQAVQLEGVRQALWGPVGWSNVGGAWTAAAANVAPAYPTIGNVFPVAEIASIATFAIGTPAGTVPLVDATSGQAPLPFDLLRTGPGGTIAANPAFGPAAHGLATLDGFSTTAMILAPTSMPIQADTVAGHVFLYALGGETPALVPELVASLGAGGVPAALNARYVAQPTPLVIPQGKNIVPGVPCPNAKGCSPVIGLQPAVPAAVPGVTTFYLPPLAENTSYAVVITTGVKDIAGHALARPTIMTLLAGSAPLYAAGHNLVPGVADDATAQALEAMRVQLAPVLAAVPGGADGVALAYTFKTQSFKQTSLKLAAAPYAIETGGATPTAIFTPTAATTATTPLPASVATVYDVTFKSIDAIDKTTGAFRATLADDLANPAVIPTLLTDLHAMVVVPASVGAIPACPGAPSIHCAPLVVFGHGLNGNKEQVLAVAGLLAQQGFAVAAIDLPLHGARNWCRANADCVVPGTSGVGTCTPFPGGAAQGDPVAPGVCTGGSVPKVDGSHYFIGANFFRTRDAIRQNVLDQSALVLALARPPASQGIPQPTANPLAQALGAGGLAIDPRFVSYEGLSLGSIVGTSAVASNPRFGNTVLSVGGGALVDVFTNAPAFKTDVETLFTGLLHAQLGDNPFHFELVTPGNDAFNLGVAQAYLQTVNVAKWILDPGEPLNYADHLTKHPLPNPLDPQHRAQAAKPVFFQIAENDPVVPNPWNHLLEQLIGTVGTTTYTGAAATHAMLAMQPKVQQGAAAFLADGTTVPAGSVSLP